MTFDTPTRETKRDNIAGARGGVVSSPRTQECVTMSEKPQYKDGDLLSVTQAAEELGVTTRWVRKLINDKKLDAIMIGAQYAIRWEDVKAYKERQ